MGFQYENEAKKFLVALTERLAVFGLTLHPEKTRLIEFGRYAAIRRQRRGLGKPETFDFLGFTHCCRPSDRFIPIRRNDFASLPEARAGCVNRARPDPCGGQRATVVPTATHDFLKPR